MLKNITLFVLSFLSFTGTYAQKSDSTADIRTNLLMQLKFSKDEISYEGDDPLVFHTGDSVKASIFHIDDKKIRKSLFSVTVKEYKNGVKLAEEKIFDKTIFNESGLFSSTEDTSCVFSLFRKQVDPKTIMFGYRIPSEIITRSYKVNDPSDFIMVSGLPYPGKVPLDKPFTLFLYTLPDSTNNFPFYKTGVWGKTDPGKWSELYKLKHSFVIDVTIHQPD